MYIVKAGKKESIFKKIEKMYENYGMDISNMSEEEFDRLIEMYSGPNHDIDVDLKKSEKFKNVFSDDVI
jgi:hypothetical protein